MTISICIVGDLTYDTVTHLSQQKLDNIKESFYAREKIEVAIGGTALNPAIQAKNLGFSSVHIVSKVGVNKKTNELDFAAQEMVDYLNVSNIKHHLIADSNASTGRTMITYFSEDERMLVADRAASQSFDINQITIELIDVIRQSDILFISGYWLMAKEQAEATVRLMKESSQAGKLVVLDVVPHKIHEILTLNSFLAYSKYADILVSESNTLARLFPELNHLADSFSESPEIAKMIFDNYHYKSLIIAPSNEIQYAYNRSGLIAYKETGYSEASKNKKRGFLDSCTMQVLYNYYDRFKN